MDFLAKCKETVVSVVPIMVIVLLLHFTIAPMGTSQLIEFLIGGVLLILGLSIFLLGADIGMIPLGQKIGSALTHKRNIWLMIIAGFVIGFVITIAEPDVHVLVTQVTTVNPSVPSTLLLIMIATGVGVFVSVGMARIIFQISLKWVLLIGYAVIFALAAFTSKEFIGIAFDAGGATTGPMTVPFIMALGLGVASVKKNSAHASHDDSFGLVGVASMGPIFAVLLMGMLFKNSGTPAAEVEATVLTQTGVIQHFLHLLPEMIQEVAIALAPVLVMFVLAQIFLLKLPFGQIRKIIIGLVYTFVGLVIFFTGVNGGFLQAGQVLGSAISGLAQGWILVPVGLVLGAVVVCAEPAVWVLNEQVEDVSGGTIRKSVMLVALCIGVALGVGLSMLRVITGMSIWWLLIPGYATALILTHFTPPLFTAIAFDSGGVASGPMSSTFILSFTLGASAALGGNPITDAFGVVAMIAMVPLITIQILGLIFQRKQRKLEESKVVWKQKELEQAEAAQGETV